MKAESPKFGSLFALAMVLACIAILAADSFAFVQKCRADDFPSTDAPFPNAEKVGRAITNGMSRSDVLKRFGKPFRQDFSPDGGTTDTYAMPVQIMTNPAPDKLRYSGFKIVYRKGKVTWWSPTYSSGILTVASRSAPWEIPTNSSLEDLAVSNGVISFFLVYDLPRRANLLYIDTADLPRLGYVEKSPTLIIREVQSVEEETEGFVENKRLRLVIELGEDDGLRFKEFTMQHIGQRLLIIVDHTPVSAPVILEPILDGKLEITMQNTLRDKEKLTAIKRALEKLVKHRSDKSAQSTQ